MPPSTDFPALTPADVVWAVERIVADCCPATILAFGSRVRGQARLDSDLDLLVVLRAPAVDRSAVGCHLRALLADAAFSKDILVSDPEHFASWRTHVNSVYRDAYEEEIPLWRDGSLDHHAAELVCR